MKATGIVRRIDDLGRIVIPKEIRKFMRIKEGDPLEMFTNEEGILFKKYSAFTNLEDYAQDHADTLNETLGRICIITDRDKVITTSGVSKRDYVSKPISSRLEEIMNDRKAFLSNKESINVIDEQPDKFRSIVIYPIISEGEVIGSVILASIDSSDMGNVELKLAENTALLLSKEIEC
jgi:AbrB family transcriptional regulator (stage V sporulation protein T)